MSESELTRAVANLLAALNDCIAMVEEHQATLSTNERQKLMRAHLAAAKAATLSLIVKHQGHFDQ